MSKNFFHNDKLINDDFRLKNSEYKSHINEKNTDINKLLNRVKLNQQIEKKEKFIFLSLGVSFVAFIGFFISIIR